MNPRQIALKIFEQQALAMRKMEDPIAAIEYAIWSERMKAFDEAIKVCEQAKSDVFVDSSYGPDKSTESYNDGCDECIKGIMLKKGRIEF